MLARGDGQRSELLWLRGDQLGAALAVDLAAAQATWAPAGGRGAMPEQVRLAGVCTCGTCTAACTSHRPL